MPDVNVDAKKIDDIARVCHEANRAYCQTLGDDSQVSWDEAPPWQRESCVSGVRKILEFPNLSARMSHENWLEHKKRDGWKYGPKKDPEKKEHPAFMSYDELPETEQRKDHLFRGIVLALTLPPNPG